jgi:hypothetical protein
MQQTLRPYVTAGIAVVGASMIAVTPMIAQSPDAQVRPVRLVDAWSTLIADTTANVDNIVSNANTSDISQLFSAFLTNPVGVIEAATNLDPTVTTTTGTDPLLQVSVELTPALEYLLGQLGASGATIEAINSVATQLQADPSNAFSILYEGTASVLNAYLNGADNVSLLGGIIDIPLFNGVLAPEQSATVDLNLTDLLNALGLGNLDLSNLNLSGLLSDLGLGNLTLGGLVSDLNLGDEGLGTLLSGLGSPITSTSDLLTALGLGSLSDETLITALTNAGLLTGLDTTVLDALDTALGTTTVGALLDDGSANFTDLLNTAVPNLSALLGDLNLSNLPIDLSSLTGLLTPTLDQLLGDLGLGDVADVSINPLGGLVTELVDTVPQQILAAL